MCKNIKTYKQYKKDYKKAKDNLIINVLNPVFTLVKDVANNPFDTVTKILPNVAYFIDNNGLSQAVGNLLALFADGYGAVHVAVFRGLRAVEPVVGVQTVVVHIVLAGFRGQHAGDSADRPLDQTIITGLTADDFTVRGAAGGAVLCAELLKAQGYITKK